MPSPVRQLIIQAAAALVVCAAAKLLGVSRPEPWLWGVLAAVTGLCAALVAWGTGEPPWWRLIHLGFLPMVWAVNRLALDPGWFLLGFLLLLLVYRGAVSGRVPLYLSNARTAARLVELVRERQARRVLDLGAGIGSITGRLARSGLALSVTGVENAPLTWLIGWVILRVRGVGRVEWRYGSLWELDWAGFDLIYAFLSPEPMAALWEKACREMPVGSMLVSNSFPVPDVTPSALIPVDDARQTQLYCYRVGPSLRNQNLVQSAVTATEVQERPGLAVVVESMHPTDHDVVIAPGVDGLEGALELGDASDQQGHAAIATSDLDVIPPVLGGRT
jgi:SAM-dependent methyltransferase